MSPRVSVVMAVHNGERHVTEAIDSILGQTLADLELVIVDDASSDSTPDLLRQAAAGDSRIRVIRNDVNLGPYPSANIGLGNASAPFIARMDADDVSEPSRLEAQVSFLESHPEHLLVGSGYRSIDDAGASIYERRNPLGDFSLRWVARFRMPMVHPSFCFRAALPSGAPVRYDESAAIAQDYALVTELLRRGKGEVLEPVLVRYRSHGKAISATRRPEQNQTAIRVASQFLRDECGSATADGFEGLLGMLYGLRDPNRDDLAWAVRSFNSMIERDASGNGTRRRWMKRRAAGILAEAYLSGGSKPSRIGRAMVFAVRHPRYVIPLGLRAMEIKELIKTLPGP